MRAAGDRRPAGGPTDEFCPPEAGWRIRSPRRSFPHERVDTFATAGRPWVLEPDRAHLVELLRELDRRSATARRAPRAAGARGRAGDCRGTRSPRATRTRLATLAARVPRLAGAAADEPFPLAEDGRVRVLADPGLAAAGSARRAARAVVRGDDRDRRAPACTCSPTRPSTETRRSSRRSSSTPPPRAGADLDGCADINVLMEPMRADRDARLHAAVDAYVPLHRGSAGHIRLAQRAGNALIEPGRNELAALLGAVAETAPVAG